MSEEHAGDLTGRRLGHYRITGVLGEGGMSVLYRATDTRLGRNVALKVIGEHLGADAEFRQRFVDEARNTAAIDHPNIVPVFDFGELDGLHYIAMRLVDGSDLAGIIAAGPIEPRRALGLLEQVADALDALHRRGLVHLDIKPANVLVARRQALREHVYVADFGLTRRGATGHRTRGGDFLGSPTYAAPEHLRGEALDGRADQYALACVLYACLAGRPPFGGDVSTVIKGHLHGEPTWASTVVPALPRAVDHVLARGMAKNPGDRYAGCVELIEAARTVLAAPGAAFGQGGPDPHRGAAPSLGNGHPLAAPGGAVASVPFGVQAPPAQLHSAQSSRAHPAPDPPRSAQVGAAAAFGSSPLSTVHTPPRGLPAPSGSPPPSPLHPPPRGLPASSGPAPGTAFPGAAARQAGGAHPTWLVVSLGAAVALLLVALVLALGV